MHVARSHLCFKFRSGELRNSVFASTADLRVLYYRELAGALFSEAVAAPSINVCQNVVAERCGLPEEAQLALPYGQLQAAATITVC